MSEAEVIAILAEREKTHGDFRAVSDVFAEIVGILDLAPGRQDNITFTALTMIAMKLARIRCGDPWHEDHVRDIEGYARLMADACRSGFTE